jgi:FKBP-type peptidyl-prolyl cis-trans isomerase
LFSFDSSKERGEFNTKIGVKKVIQGTSAMSMSFGKEMLIKELGWDEGVVQMTLGEVAVLTIPG